MVVDFVISDDGSIDSEDLEDVGDELDDERIFDIDSLGEDNIIDVEE